MSLDQPTDLVKHQTTTRDAFLGGRLTLSQPRNGFRAGQDSVLLGAAVPQGTKNLLDLGAGVGTAGLVALSLGRAQGLVMVEREPEALSLAAENVADNGFSGRVGIVEVDISTSGKARRDAGLADNDADVVIANPPFFAAGQGTLAAGDDRANARHMDEGALALWVRCAAASARAGGQVIFIYPAEGLADLLAALNNRFGAIAILPLASRPAGAANRVLVRGIKGSRAKLTLMATRFLHGETGNGFSAEFDAIFRGTAALDW